MYKKGLIISAIVVGIIGSVFFSVKDVRAGTATCDVGGNFDTPQGSFIIKSLKDCWATAQMTAPGKTPVKTLFGSSGYNKPVFEVALFDGDEAAGTGISKRIFYASSSDSSCENKSNDSYSSVSGKLCGSISKKVSIQQGRGSIGSIYVYPKPVIKISTPSIGQKYTVGQAVPLAWTSENIDSAETVTVGLRSDQFPNTDIISKNFLNTGKTSFTLTSDQLSGVSLSKQFWFVVTYNFNSPQLVYPLEFNSSKFTISQPSACVISSFTSDADVDVIGKNESVMLSWTTTGCAGVTLDGSSVTTSGTKTTGALSATKTFTLNATSASGAAQTKSLTVKVASVSSEGGTGSGTGTGSGSGTGTGTGTSTGGTTTNSVCTINSFAVAPTTVTSGSSATLVWATTGCTSVSIDGSAVDLTGTKDTGILAITKSFILSARNGSGTPITRTVTVTVTPRATATSCSITSFEADDSVVAVGDSTILRWQTTGCAIATLNGSAVALSGSKETKNLTETTSFVLIAVNSSGASVKKTISVTVGDDSGATTNSTDTGSTTSTDPMVILISPSGGESFIQGKAFTISWKGGKGGVRVGIISGNYSTTTSSIKPIGWIDVDASVNGTTRWDGKTLQKYINSSERMVIPAGTYKIVLVSQDSQGRYNTTLSSESNIDISAQAITLESTAPIQEFPEGTTDGSEVVVTSPTTTTTTATTTTTTTSTPTRTLRRGSRGDDVVALQKALKKKGLLSTRATGYYGTATQKAVRAYQKRMKTKITGIADVKIQKQALAN